MIQSSNRPWALILGSSSGFGKKTVEQLFDLGMNIIGVHFDSNERTEEIGEFLDKMNLEEQRVWFFNENIARASSQTKVIQEAIQLVKDEGGFKTVVHSVAFGSLKRFIPDEDNGTVITRKNMEMTVDVMAHSLVYWIQELFEKRLLLKNCQIIGLTSFGSARTWQSYGAVSAAKASLESHVRQLAVELAPHQIAVNAIRAGVTDTPALRKIPGNDHLIQKMLESNPHRRLTDVQDVASAIGMLALTESCWLTGNIICVDGGEFIVA